MTYPSFQVPVGFPVFGIGFDTKNNLVAGGGGGPSHSGIKNKLVYYKIDIRRKDLEEDAVYEFSQDEDAVMCLDVHPHKPCVMAGVNSTKGNIEAGKNENCRMFNIQDDKFEPVKCVSTLESKYVKDYQRVVRFSEDGSLFAVGTTEGKVQVFKFPGMESICEEITVCAGDEVQDVDINLENEKLTCVSRDSIKLVNLRGKNIGQIIQTISSSTIIKNSKSEFRSFRYGKGYSKDYGYAIVNGITQSASYVIQYDAYSLEQIKMVKLSNSKVTTCGLSPDGAILGVGFADYSISAVNTMNLKTLFKQKNAHSFSITSIAISADRRILATGSADNTCHIVSLPAQFDQTMQINPLHTLLLAILVAAVTLCGAVFYDKFMMNESTNETNVITTTMDSMKQSTVKVDGIIATTTEDIIATVTEDIIATVTEDIIAATAEKVLLSTEAIVDDHRNEL
ncbi:WD40-repeat-containing domain protein [Pilobolus umbonatus]|nr:WD40-repeat-containing domain protein [Pilobolus umbonatus]